MIFLLPGGVHCGGVCDDSFDLKDAHVLCRMAGYPEGASEYFNNSSPFGYGSSGHDFAVDDLKCTGNETSIDDCQHKEWYTDDCSKTEWAGVRCSGEPSVLVRLGGSSTMKVMLKSITRIKDGKEFAMIALT